MCPGFSFAAFKSIRSPIAAAGSLFSVESPPAHLVRSWGIRGRPKPVSGEQIARGTAARIDRPNRGEEQMSSDDFNDHSRDANGRPGSGVVKLAAVFSALCIAGMGGLWLFGTFGHEEPSELMLFLGRFHPLIVHLPIGGLVLIFTLEIMSLLTARKWKPRTLGPLVFTAFASIAAVACGYMLGGEFTEPEVLWHFRWALIFTALVLVTLTLRVASARGGGGAGLLSAITLLGSVAALSIAGHLGATITHGPTYITQYAPESIKPTLEKLLGLEPREAPTDDDDADATSSDEAPNDDDAQVVPASFTQRDLYVDIVQPILIDHCGACHGEGRQRAQLRVDDHAAILAGGENGPSVVAGDADSSLIVDRIELPIEDFDHMPPEGRDQLTVDEIVAIRIWVAAGAPESGAIETFTIPGESLEVLRRLDEAMNPPATDDGAVDTSTTNAAEETSSPSANLDQRVQTVNEQIGGGAQRLARDSSHLVFSAATQSRAFTDEHLAMLGDIATELIEVDLSFTSVTADGLARMKPMPALRKFTLSHTNIDDAAMSAVAKNMPNIEVLIAFNTNLTDAGLESLRGCGNLQRVYVGQTQVTADAAKQFEQAHGSVECIGDWELSDAGGSSKQAVPPDIGSDTQSG